MSSIVANQRMLPAVVAPSTALLSGRTRAVNGRTFTAVAGTTVDAVAQDADVLQANNWFNTAGPNSVGVGTTAARPTTGLFPGASYADTTTGNLIVYDGTTWRNPVSGVAV